ncbi:MAG: hypothetical protein JRD89_20950 [Deltaproteobacteria bacterium]|nr:hypothetical protein [Deltaproteobacteria bacterium]
MKLESTATQEGAKQEGNETTKKPTKAAAPIKPLAGVERVKKDPSKMPQSEFEAWRNAGGG